MFILLKHYQVANLSYDISVRQQTHFVRYWIIEDDPIKNDRHFTWAIWSNLPNSSFNIFTKFEADNCSESGVKLTMSAYKILKEISLFFPPILRLTNTNTGINESSIWFHPLAYLTLLYRCTYISWNLVCVCLRASWHASAIFNIMLLFTCLNFI